MNRLHNRSDLKGDFDVWVCENEVSGGMIENESVRTQTEWGAKYSGVGVKNIDDGNEAVAPM